MSLIHKQFYAAIMAALVLLLGGCAPPEGDQLYPYRTTVENVTRGYILYKDDGRWQERAVGIVAGAEKFKQEVTTAAESQDLTRYLLDQILDRIVEASPLNEMQKAAVRDVGGQLIHQWGDAINVDSAVELSKLGVLIELADAAIAVASNYVPRAQ